MYLCICICKCVCTYQEALQRVSEELLMRECVADVAAKHPEFVCPLSVHASGVSGGGARGGVLMIDPVVAADGKFSSCSYVYLVLVYMYVCVYACMPVCTYVCCMCIHTHIHPDIFKCLCVCIYVCLSVSLCICPFVCICSGWTYERSNIERWIRDKGGRGVSPKTGDKFSNTFLNPNLLAKAGIAQAMEEARNRKLDALVRARMLLRQRVWWV